MSSEIKIDGSRNSITAELPQPHTSISVIDRLFPANSPVADVRPFGKAIVGGCPACGPVSASATSRYCLEHLREMQARYFANRDSNLARAS
jgi:hypothetical protein